MTYVLFLVACYVVAWFCAKYNVELPSNDAMIIVAILTAGEVISWRCKK